MRSNTRSRYSWSRRLLAALLTLVTGVTVACRALIPRSASGSDASATARSDSAARLPVDPWELGPDVFHDSPDSSALPEPPALEPPHVTVRTRYSVRIGTFQNKSGAEELLIRASQALGLPARTANEGPIFRVEIGDYEQRSAADSLASVAVTRGFYDSRVVENDPERDFGRP